MDKFYNFFLTEEAIITIFWYCVDILNVICDAIGITYEALNIWVFIVIQPALILLFLVSWFICLIKLRTQRHTISILREQKLSNS